MYISYNKTNHRWETVFEKTKKCVYCPSYFDCTFTELLFDAFPNYYSVNYHVIALKLQYKSKILNCVLNTRLYIPLKRYFENPFGTSLLCPNNKSFSFSGYQVPCWFLRTPSI